MCIISLVLELIARANRVAVLIKGKHKHKHKHAADSSAAFTVMFEGALVSDGGNDLLTDKSIEQRNIPKHCKNNNDDKHRTRSKKCF